MKTVWVIHDMEGIAGIYSSKEIAEEAQRRLGGNPPEEMPLDQPMPELIDGQYAWHVVFHKGKLHDVRNIGVDEIRNEVRDIYASGDYLYVARLAKTKEEAIASAQASVDALKERS